METLDRDANQTQSRHGNTGIIILVLLAAILMLLALAGALLYAPTERTMGDVQRIFYFHLASAWVSFAAYLVAFIASIGYLLRRIWERDHLATASVEIGVLFSTITILTGSLWARPVWNTWWTWDPRLMTTLILWVYYLGVLTLRQFVDTLEQRARYAAVLNIIGFINVPMVFMAIRWWRTIHPVLLTERGMALSPPMLLTLGLSLAAFSLLYVSLLIIRKKMISLRHRINVLYHQ